MSPQQGQEGIEQQEAAGRGQDAPEAAPVETAHTDVRPHGHQQESAHNHEERNTDASQAAVVESHPETVGLVGEHGHVAGQPGGVCRIEILTGVYQHDQEACRHADVVDKDDSSVVCHHIRNC